MSFLSSKTQMSIALRSSKSVSYAAFRGLEPNLYSITILRTVLYEEIIWGVDKVYSKAAIEFVLLSF